jgi:hypothetical protein
LVISTAHSQGITKSLSAKDLVVQVAILLVLCCILSAVLTGEEQMHSEKSIVKGGGSQGGKGVGDFFFRGLLRN